MLWMKGWLETRFRLLFAVVGFGVFALLISSNLRATSRTPSEVPPTVRVGVSLATCSMFLAMQAILLAGSGIKTQAPFRPGKGLHGSLHFTLSLPVSRGRIAATRIALGLLELLFFLVAACVALWFALIPYFPQLHATAGDLARYGVTLAAVMSACFFLSTLFSTFLDDVWQVWGTMIVVAVAGGIFEIASVPDSVHPFAAVGVASPVVTHSIPWGVVGPMIGIAAVLLFATLKVVDSRDY